MPIGLGNPRPQDVFCTEAPELPTVFFGQLISFAGTWMQIIAQGWLVYKISGSEFALGLSALPQQFRR